MAEETTQNDTTPAANTDTSSTTPAAEPVSALAAISESLGYEKDGSAPVADEAVTLPDEAAKPAVDPKTAKTEAKPAVDPKTAKTEAKPAVDPKTAAKPTDVDEKPPAGLSPDATRRFQTLVGEKKKLAAEVEELRPFKERVAQFEDQAEALKGFNAVFDESKCKPEQFGQAMDVIKAFNSGDYDRVAAVLHDQLRQIALLTGKDIAPIDPLAAFPDLLQAEQAQLITRGHALELARGRNAEHVARQTQQRTQETQQAQQASEQEITQGGAAVDKWVTAKQNEDIDFPAKAAKLSAELNWLAENVPPRQWVTHLEKWYGMLGSVTAAKPAAPSFQPLRANGGAPNAKPSAGSMLEAISSGLGYGA